MQPSHTTANILVLDTAGDTASWAHDALTGAGLACTVAADQAQAHRALDTARAGLVIMPVTQQATWGQLLTRLNGAEPPVLVLGLVADLEHPASRAAQAVGITELLARSASADELATRATDLLNQADSVQTSPIATLRAVTEAAEQALFRAETAEARVARASERQHLRTARDSLSHSLQVLLGTMVGTAEAGPCGRVGHSRVVASLARRMAQELGWAPERVRGMELAGLLHDIGMLALPPDLLATPGPLDENRRRLLHTHPDASADILEPLSRVGVPVSAVRAHHERLDGSGYPRGLKGKEIPLAAELLAMADTYAALTHDRPHRPAHTQEAALHVLQTEVEAGRMSAKAVTVLTKALTRPVTRGDGPDGRRTLVG